MKLQEVPPDPARSEMRTPFSFSSSASARLIPQPTSLGQQRTGQLFGDVRDFSGEVFEVGVALRGWMASWSGLRCR